MRAKERQEAAAAGAGASDHLGWLLKGHWNEADAPPRPSVLCDAD